MYRAALLTICMIATACPGPDPDLPPHPAASGVASALHDAGAIVDATAPPDAAEAVDAAVPEKKTEAPHIDAKRALKRLFLDAPTDEARACLTKADRPQRIECMLRLRYPKDKAAQKLVLDIYAETGSVVGLEPARMMNGGWRGMLKLVPQRPVGRYRRHLMHIRAAHREFHSFFAALQKHSDKPLPYRHEPIEYKFFRSVKRTTPSAYATGWSVAYNVSGSLHRSAKAVRDTLFHEVFHLNDHAHGKWSGKKLTAVYDEIVSRCTLKNRRLSTRCLTPYAPNSTMVRGGTYYAFQPGNGVWEYSAELAIRYFHEHLTVLAKKRLRKRAFKCGPAENAKAWKLFADEFFAGVDLIPACK